MVDLQIRQLFGKIGLQITPFQYDLNIQPPNLEVKQKFAQITMEQPAATLEIDYTPARESLGYNGIATQLRVFNQEAMATWDAGIERRVREGEELGSIEKKIPIAQVIKEATAFKDKELELVNIAPIEVHIEQSPLRWQAVPGNVQVFLVPGTVHGEFQYGQVRSYLEQTPSISLKAMGTIFDEKS